MGQQHEPFSQPIALELQRLRQLLFDLVSDWSNVERGIKHQDEIIAEYHATLQRMFDLGWRGGLDIECELPYSLMPTWYVEQDLTPVQNDSE